MRLQAKIIFSCLILSLILCGCSSSFDQEKVNLQNRITELEKELAKEKNSKVDISAFEKLYNEPIKYDIDDPMGMTYYSQQRLKGKALDASFSIEDPLAEIDQIRSYLDSFRDLTDKSRKYFTQKQLESIGNTEAGLQLIGFHNIPTSITGALYDQNLIIRKQALALAIEQYKDGKITKEDLDIAAKHYQNFKLKYEEFILKATYGD